MTDLQARLLELLKELDRLCRKHGVEYYLTGGSLIGAVRHRGFIPWDDDADVIMTRDNWEKFYPAVLEDLPENIALNSQDTDEDLAIPISHFTDITTTGIYRYFISNPENAGVVIDILVMDPVPDTPEDRELYVRAVTELMELTNPYYQYSLRIEKETDYEKNLKRAKQEGRRAVMDSIVSRAFHYSEEESQLYAQRFASAPHFWPKEYFGTPRYVPFEDTMLPIPQRAGDCLCIGYDDDWMFIPQGGPNKSTHEFCVHDYEVPCQVMLDEFESYIDRPKVMALIEERKLLQVARTDQRISVENKLDELTKAKICLLTKRALESEDLSALLEDGDYDRLEFLFKDYFESQLSNRFVGSSSLTNWYNWARKCRPVLIDIGDGPIYAAVMTLMHAKKLAAAGKVLKARKRADRPMTEQLMEADAFYQTVREIRSLYERGERDAACDQECADRLALWMEKQPSQPLLEIMDIKQRARRGMDPQDLLEEAEGLLEKYPGDPELSGLCGDALYAQGRLEEMTQLYSRLAENCTPGLVMLGMRERMRELCEKYPEREDWYELWIFIRRQSGEPEESLPGEEEESGEEEALGVGENDSETEEQEGPLADEEAFDVDSKQTERQIRLQLLTELDAICREEKISCFLAPGQTLQAYLHGTFLDEGDDIGLYIKAGDAAKLVEAVWRKALPDRAVDSMELSPDFPRFCLRYINTSTLDIAASECQRKGPCGIFVRIELLRRPSKIEAVNQWNRMLEIGWESFTSVKYSSAKVRTARIVIGGFRAICGPKAAGRLLYRHFTKEPVRADRSVWYIKPMWGLIKPYPAELFDDTEEIAADGRKFRTSWLKEKYLEAAYGPRYREKMTIARTANPVTRIIDSRISAPEYFEYLESEGIDRAAIRRDWYKNNKSYDRVRTLGGFIRSYWHLYMAIGERHRLYREYMPMKDRLLELRAEGKAQEMMDLLDDYSFCAKYFAKRKIGLTFDRDLSSLLLYAMYSTGHKEEADHLKSAFKQQKWVPLPETRIKTGSAQKGE